MTNIFKSFRQNTIVLIDGANLFYAQKSLGAKIDYQKLYDFLHQYRRLVEIRIYLALKQGSEKEENFVRKLRDIGYKVICKKLKIIKTSEKTFVKKGNLDIELALDAYKMREKYRTIVLFSGDGDFAILFRELRKLRKQCIFCSIKGHAGRELFETIAQYIDLKKIWKNLKK